MVIHRVIIFDAILEKQLLLPVNLLNVPDVLASRISYGGLFANLPPRRHAASGWFAATKVRQHFVGLIEDVSLLLHRHVHWVLVGVPVQADLVAGIPDHSTLFGEGLEGMPRDEPASLDVVDWLVSTDWACVEEMTVAGERLGLEPECGRWPSPIRQEMHERLAPAQIHKKLVMEA